ncbi:MAG: DUF1559 domain-containing protein [Planctomycetaceae bacterium]|nr:DUF1559 domain-containing protein [Planctomycetaceae bacterium]
MRRAVSRKREMRLGLSTAESLVVVAILCVTIALLLPPVQQPRGPHITTSCRNNLVDIGLAIEYYEETYKVLPPAYTIDADGTPLHSWRTLILPYLDEKDLYDSIDLTRPWDDPVNAAAFEQMPYIYKCPGIKHPTNRTMYLGIVGKDKFFSGSMSRKLEEITDKHDETIMIIEVPEDQGVPWMAPLDADEKLILSFDAETKWPHPKRRIAAFVEGKPQSLPTTTTPEELRRMLTIAGGD